jgi:hypothetical protein
MLIPALALSLLAAAPEAPVYDRPDVLVWNIQGEAVKKKVPGWVTDQVSRRAGKNPHVDVISSAEVKRLAGLEAERQMMGAADEGRMRAIAAKVDAELVIFGTARLVNKQVEVELQLFAPDSAKALNRVKASAPTLKALEPDLARATDALIGKALKKPAPDEAAAVARLADALGGKSARVRPMVVADTPFSSAFGSLFASKLQAAVKGEGPELVGSYRENADVVEIAVATADGARRAQTRMIRAAVSEAALRPANLSRAAREQRVLKAQRAGDIHMEAWTEKGAVGVVFTENEEYHFFVKVSRPAWVRVIYHLAGGERALIEQAWRVKKADEAIRYPDTFAAAPPFGIERVQLIAFAAEPPPLRTTGKTIEGTDYLLIKSLDDTVRYRGFKRVKKSGYAEALITITTTP